MNTKNTTEKASALAEFAQEYDCMRCEETFTATVASDYCPKCSRNMNRTDMQRQSAKAEFAQELPLQFLDEYDGAADCYARTGELPRNMGSPGALDYIQADPEAFKERVRDIKYAIAMEGRQP